VDTALPRLHRPDARQRQVCLPCSVHPALLPSVAPGQPRASLQFRTTAKAKPWLGDSLGPLNIHYSRFTLILPFRVLHLNLARSIDTDLDIRYLYRYTSIVGAGPWKQSLFPRNIKS